MSRYQFKRPNERKSNHVAEPGTYVTRETETRRTVDGIEYTITRLEWNGTSGLSFDVYTGEGDCLTEEESLDNEPTDEDIRSLRDFDD